MQNVIFGACTVTHGSTVIGATSGGGSLTILEKENELVGTEYDVEIIPYAVEGTINKFTLSSGVITNTMQLAEKDVLTFTGNDFVITVHNAALFYPSSITFGTWSASAFQLRFRGGRDAEGKLITLEGV